MGKVVLGPWQHSGNSKHDMHRIAFGSQALRFDAMFFCLRNPDAGSIIQVYRFKAA